MLVVKRRNPPRTDAWRLSLCLAQWTVIPGWPLWEIPSWRSFFAKRLISLEPQGKAFPKPCPRRSVLHSAIDHRRCLYLSCSDCVRIGQGNRSVEIGEDGSRRVSCKIAGVWRLIRGPSKPLQISELGLANIFESQSKPTVRAERNAGIPGKCAVGCSAEIV